MFLKKYNENKVCQTNKWRKWSKIVKQKCSALHGTHLALQTLPDPLRWWWNTLNETNVNCLNIFWVPNSELMVVCFDCWLILSFSGFPKKNERYFRRSVIIPFKPMHELISQPHPLNCRKKKHDTFWSLGNCFAHAILIFYSLCYSCKCKCAYKQMSCPNIQQT